MSSDLKFDEIFGFANKKHGQYALNLWTVLMLPISSKKSIPPGTLASKMYFSEGHFAGWPTKSIVFGSRRFRRRGRYVMLFSWAVPVPKPDLCRPLTRLPSLEKKHLGLGYCLTLMLNSLSRNISWAWNTS